MQPLTTVVLFVWLRGGIGGGSCARPSFRVASLGEPEQGPWGHIMEPNTIRRPYTPSPKQGPHIRLNSGLSGAHTVGLVSSEGCMAGGRIGLCKHKGSSKAVEGATAASEKAAKVWQCWYTVGSSTIATSVVQYSPYHSSMTCVRYAPKRYLQVCRSMYCCHVFCKPLTRQYGIAVLEGILAPGILEVAGSSYGLSRTLHGSFPKSKNRALNTGTTAT